ncbi:hypothetical protein ACNA6I_14095 [Rossellomorea sp. FS2]|uniref:hypothetical protein n=1 Tax=Rossellomorea sp. FS2 TaxID=3391447 RepID=UPI003A4D7ED0
MKLFLQSIAFSIAIHILYFLGTLVAGFINTRNYTPNFETAGSLTSDVAFGTTASPLLLPVTFICFAVIGGALITLFKSKSEVY